MRNSWVVAVAVICLALSPLGLRPGAADEAAAPAGAPGNAPDGFPSYSREDVARVCLSEYGMGNSSVLECLAQDQKVRSSLVRKWEDIDEHFRTSCLMRLADLHANSYSHLDACVRSAEKQKDALTPE